MQCGIIAVLTPMALLLLLIMRLIHQRTCNRCLALVDNGVRLATKEGRNDIKEYCFEVMDMCRLQMDFEKCEVDYPDLCLNYSKYIAEKKKKREGVPRQRTITVEEIFSYR